ncbi:UNC93-like protein like [Argiope bruennichi]|uniref:UNC93-like protein like n=1 Tax=Argiope bruennichi TaxID=94029 RepID=A0A8T0F5Q1_ARGBR|nr:UNC93-like protein like [Argiope bruennichi]
MQVKTQSPECEAGVQCCQPKIFTQFQILKNVAVVCAGVLLLFTAYDGLTMLQSTMNKEQGIGVWSQAIMYFFFSVSAIFFPKYVIKKFGTKTTYAFSMLTYIPYIASNFYSHWVLVIPVSILIFLGAALIWGAQASYLNNVSVMYVDISTSSSGRNIPHESISSISNNITPCRYEMELKSNSIATIVSKSDIENSPDANSQQYVKNKYNTSINDKFYSVPFKNAEYSNIVENGKVNRSVQMNSKAAEVMARSEEGRKRLKMIESTTARFFGFHGVAYLTCHLWGNLLTYFILQTDVEVNATNNSTCVCGASFCNVASACFEQNVELPSERMRYILTATCVCIGVIALLIVVFFLDPLENEKEEVTFSTDLLMATYKLAKKKELVLLIPASFYIGMVQGFYTGDFTKSFVGCAWGTYHVGLVAASYGSLCGLSSFSSGWLVKRLGRIPIFSAASLTNIAACALMLAWKPTADEPVMFFVIAGMWGVHVGAIWSQLRAFYGILFKADEEAAFAAFHVWYALGFCLSFAYSNYFCTYVKIYVLIVVGTLGFIGYLTVEILCFKNKASK